MLGIIQVLLLLYACTLDPPPPQPGDGGTCSIVQQNCGEGG